MFSCAVLNKNAPPDEPGGALGCGCKRVLGTAQEGRYLQQTGGCVAAAMAVAAGGLAARSVGRWCGVAGTLVLGDVVAEAGRIDDDPGTAVRRGNGVQGVERGGARCGKAFGNSRGVDALDDGYGRGLRIGIVAGVRNCSGRPGAIRHVGGKVRIPRPGLNVHAVNLGNFMRTLALPDSVEQWSLTTLREKLIKIGAKIVRHGRYVIFQMAEVAIPRDLFADILRRIDRLRPTLTPA